MNSNPAKSLFLICGLLVMVTHSVITSVQAIPMSTETGERINWQVVSSNGAPATSANFMLRGTAGQTTITAASSGSFGLLHGYWQDFGPYTCGDVNGDGVVDVGDIVYLVNYLYRNGPPPKPLWTGNANCDGELNIGDLVYLVNYLYRNGDPPCC